MFRYLLLDHAVPATWSSLAAARFNYKADWPSGEAPTTRVRRLISRTSRLSGLLMRMVVRFSKLGRLGEAKAAQLLSH
jgi:hypothetical protein